MSRSCTWQGLTAFVAIACLAGCESAKSANPTAPSVAGPIPGVNITAPRPLEPYAGSTLVFSGEPPTLLIENAGTTGARSIWLQLDVASDSSFRQIVYQADQITPGTGASNNPSVSVSQAAAPLTATRFTALSSLLCPCCQDFATFFSLAQSPESGA